MSDILRQIQQEEKKLLREKPNMARKIILRPRRSRSIPQNPLNAKTLKPDNPFWKPNPLPFVSRLHAALDKSESVA